MQEYLAYFGSRNHEFRIPELESLAKALGIEFKSEPRTPQEHFLVRYASAQPESLAIQSTIQCINFSADPLLNKRTLWGEGNAHDDLHDPVKKYMEASEQARTIVREKSFKFMVVGYGGVDMKCPDETFWIIENVGREVYNVELPPSHVWFCRQIGLSSREMIDKYTLKRRKYLGTTSMESEISFFTATQGLARPGALFFDPFVGTGSLVISAAALGCYVIGADIDIDVLVGKSKEESVRGNFKQYGLEDRLVDLVRFDNSNNSVWRKQVPYFDAIICDPPYGIRAGAKKVGVKPKTENRHKAIGIPVGPIHINPNDPGWLEHTPQCVVYSVPDVLMDLLDFSAKSLVLGGRLVYWLPTTVEFTVEDLPTHPCFQLIANSEQKLTSYFSRRLITMEKIKAYDPSDLGHVPEQKIDVAHANISAKVQRDPARNDGRHDPNGPAQDLSAVKERVRGPDLKKMRKQARRKAKIEAKTLEASQSESSAMLSSSSDPSTQSEEPQTSPIANCQANELTKSF